MKIAAVALLVLSLFTGCSAKDDAMDRAMTLRKQLLSGEECSFHTIITADYGDRLYTFEMDCTMDANGLLSFTVTQPDTICGITGTISDNGAALTFDNNILAFPMLADGQVTPVSGPWIFANTLKCGYLTGCSREDQALVLYIDDSYEEYPLHLQIRVDEANHPVYAEIIWQEHRVMALEIQNFTIQ